VRLSVAILTAQLALGCARPEPRFADRMILWRDRDDLPSPQPPDRPARGVTRYWEGAQNGIFLPAERFFGLDYGLEAVNVNAVDEVPDSSWYHDQRRDPDDPNAPPRALSAAQIERGPLREDPPCPPFTIARSLTGGSAIGFVVDDARGRRYALKLDPVDHLGLVTSTDVVTNRLAWASGWRLPANEIVDLARNELTLAPRATMVNSWGQRTRLVSGDVDSMLERAARGRDGRYRAVMSRWIEGHILGAARWIGRDRADPNDRYDHENRRDLRGFAVWAAWVDDIDVIDNNTLDTYIGTPGAGHVEHYLLDVGGSFGSFAAAVASHWMRDQSYFQADRFLASLLTAGFVPHRWEDRGWQQRRRQLVEEYPELGGFASEHFDPRRWRPIVDVPPFVRQTERDRFWATKRIAAFSPVELRAAIAAGRYRPEAAEYLFDVLWRRREIIARDGFARISPLDHFRIDGEHLCFTDWWVRSGLGGGGNTDYRAREAGRIVDLQRGSDRLGAACVVLPAASADYRIIELAALRPGARHFGPGVAVHLIVRGAHTRVVGVVR
jgi:hypothetical protein